MKLHSKILLGLATGAVAGVAANALAPGAQWVRLVADYVAGPVGQVFLRLLLMTVIPLVFASLTLGVAGIGDLRRLGRVGGRTLAYFVLSSVLATVLGLALVNAVQPGAGIGSATREALLEGYRAQAEGMRVGGTRGLGIDTFVHIVPINPLRAAVEMDLLGVICFSLLFGAALALLPEERARPLVRGIEALADVVLKLIDFAMRLAPYGVFGLVFVLTSRFGWHLLEQLGVYVGVVVAGLLLHGLVTLSLLVRFLGGRDPLWFWRRARASLLTAFSTSSSNATLPTNIAVAERELGVPPPVAGFVLPLGATLNMNGTALYEGVTVLFLAQAFGVDLSLAQQVVVVALSVVTAIGAAGVPGGSLPLLMGVLAAVGVPPEGIAIILGVDRLLDMCRTTLNVAGDLSAAVYVARTESAALATVEQVAPPLAA
ncbi:MAG: dicarboxylate/amino acid:cation symporter [Gemmatimonadota bacterium]|nr:MAG: dicarboxylate/amino acid:cation symporter [Gemmatimonadota bacterium]